MKNWLVIYDIRDGKRLVKVSKIVESFGKRVQKSVFEVFADNSTIQKLREKIRETIDDDEDFVVYFEICLKDWHKRERYGVDGELEEYNEKYIII